MHVVCQLLSFSKSSESFLIRFSSVLKLKSLGQAFSYDCFLFACFSVDISVASKYAVPDLLQNWKGGRSTVARKQLQVTETVRAVDLQGSLAADESDLYLKQRSSKGA